MVKIKEGKITYVCDLCKIETLDLHNNEWLTIEIPFKNKRCHVCSHCCKIKTFSELLRAK